MASNTMGSWITDGVCEALLNAQDIKVIGRGPFARKVALRRKALKWIDMNPQLPTSIQKADVQMRKRSGLDKETTSQSCYVFGPDRDRASLSALDVRGILQQVEHLVTGVADEVRARMQGFVACLVHPSIQ